ncbi:twin-arginine translocase subunit TatB [Roseovarius faecimaris]|uniref:Sec-independent protein translocase protein TatB n=1 Tax=Roseovarius faecimaris TaxID=2494550 RepID=A0A6I6IP35_9RHOB|nr:Sec-independent protein translocase protein TatB [Roseovarius faecimaris]QGX98032.1 twin-arginine translocase subunit TatB [Roseovarius faecimaris]
MFDLGWTELLVIGIVALIVVGPKDLPGMFRTVGNFVGKAKRMAREFSQAMNDAADDAGMSDVKKTLDAAARPMNSAMNEVKKSTESFTQKTMNSGKPKLSPERAEAAEKIRQKSAEMANERIAREKAEAAAAEAADAKPAAKAPAPKAAEAKTAPAKKAPAKKPAAKKPAAKKAPAKAAAKPAPKAAAKKPAAKKPAAGSAGDKA